MDLVDYNSFSFVVECYVYLYNNVIGPRSQADSKFLLSSEVEIVRNCGGPDETISIDRTDNEARFEDRTVDILIEETM